MSCSKLSHLMLILSVSHERVEVTFTDCCSDIYTGGVPIQARSEHRLIIKINSAGGRLIRGSTYTRVYTVVHMFVPGMESSFCEFRLCASVRLLPHTAEDSKHQDN